MNSFSLLALFSLAVLTALSHAGRERRRAIYIPRSLCKHWTCRMAISELVDTTNRDITVIMLPRGWKVAITQDLTPKLSKMRYHSILCGILECFAQQLQHEREASKRNPVNVS